MTNHHTSAKFSPEVRERAVRMVREHRGHWVGYAAAELEPLHARLIALLKTSTKLFCDETRCPVLDPGRGRTKNRLSLGHRAR
jgi:hypothetical protein